MLFTQLAVRILLVNVNSLSLVIYFWLPWVFVAVHRPSLVAMSRGCSLVVVHGLLIPVASLVEHGL